jgi:photosystem II stability/assembly factor-like uncharacterized protein
MKTWILISLVIVLTLTLSFLFLKITQATNTYPKSTINELEFTRVSSIKESLINTVAFDLKNQNLVFAGTDKLLYISLDNGLNWDPVTSVKGFINCIFIDAEGDVYVGTSNGLFRKFKNEIYWNLIYKGKEGSGKNVLSIASSVNNILIGTSNGLYLSTDSCKTWKKVSGLEGKQITVLAVLPEDTIYAATERGLYKSTKNINSWERVFYSRNQEVDQIVNPEDLEGQEYDELTASSNQINSIVFAEQSKLLYIGTQKGVFKSQIDNGIWTLMPEQGLLSKNINKLIINGEQELFAATKNGLFKLDSTNSNWLQIYKGISSNEIKDLAINPLKKDIFVATSRGLFKSSFKEIVLDNQVLSDLLKNFSSEPVILDVQKQAIRYAEVQPEKILNWRKLAAQKALLPKVTVDVDRYLTDLNHWDSGQNPDVLLEGDDDVGWGVSVSWELGDIVWNSEQTSIDTRSRLMVQLRQDILDEVNRLYFERRRLQIELLKSPPEDELKLVEKELRIAELTADLDALTGGYFSRYIENKIGG